MKFRELINLEQVEGRAQRVQIHVTAGGACPDRLEAGLGQESGADQRGTEGVTGDIGHSGHCQLHLPDGEVGECPTCQVDLTLFEGGDRQSPQFYEVCEECGRVFIGGDFLDAGLEPEPKVVSFFRRFAVKKARPGP